VEPDPVSVGAVDGFEADEQLTNRGAASATAHTVRADSRRPLDPADPTCAMCGIRVPPEAIT
jgi:hypothetical protein